MGWMVNINRRLYKMDPSLTNLSFCTQNTIYKSNNLHSGARDGLKEDSVALPSREYPWLELVNAAFDLECKIGGMPFRFFSDDPDSPSKPGFWKSTGTLFPLNNNDPAHLRFVLEKPIDQASEAEVHFIGFNAVMEEVFRWRYQNDVSVVRAVDDQRPKAVTLAPASVQPRKSEEENSKKPEAGANSA